MWAIAVISLLNATCACLNVHGMPVAGTDEIFPILQRGAYNFFLETLWRNVFRSLSQLYLLVILRITSVSANFGAISFRQDKPPWVKGVLQEGGLVPHNPMFPCNFSDFSFFQFFRSFWGEPKVLVFFLFFLPVSGRRPEDNPLGSRIRQGRMN